MGVRFYTRLQQAVSTVGDGVHDGITNTHADARRAGKKSAKENLSISAKKSEHAMSCRSSRLREQAARRRKMGEK